MQIIKQLRQKTEQVQMLVEKLMEFERKMMLDTMKSYTQFAKKVQNHRYKIQSFFQKARARKNRDRNKGSAIWLSYVRQLSFTRDRFYLPDGMPKGSAEWAVRRIYS